MTLRTFVRSLTPPLVWTALQRLAGRRGLRFAGRPADWQDALRLSDGYTHEPILERVAQATREVVAGKAAFERDSVLFTEHEFNFPVLAALLRAAALHDGRLDVVDFGGALGSTYHQLRPFLGGLGSLRWQVVEQPAFADRGRLEFQTGELQFHSSLDRLPAFEAAPVALALGVVQYLEHPLAQLTALSRVGASHLVIDRAPLSQCHQDRLCIQHTPAQIYRASYPMWVLSRARLLECLQSDWHLLAEFDCEEGVRRTDDGLVFEFCGLILERRPPQSRP